MAHSMGNILVGSALREGANVRNYALMNAAIPAECYDDSEDLRNVSKWKALSSRGMKIANLITKIRWSGFNNWAKPSIGADPNPKIASRGYRGYLKGVSCNLINFYLPKDFATEEAWEFHNATQKPLGGSNRMYKYILGQRIEKYRNAGTSRNPFKRKLILDDVTDSHEVMACIDSSKTKVAGTEGKMAAAESIDMDKDGMNFDREHSAQFVWGLQRTWGFWKKMESWLK